MVQRIRRISGTGSRMVSMLILVFVFGFFPSRQGVRQAFAASEVQNDRPSTLLTASAGIKQVAFSGSGGYVLLTGFNGYHTHNVPPALNDELRKLNDNKVEIKQVAFVYGTDAYVILYGRNAFIWSGGVFAEAINKIREANAKNVDIRQIEFFPGNAVMIVYGGGNGYIGYAKRDLLDAMKGYNARGDIIHQIAAVPNQQGYIVLYGNGGWEAHLTPSNLISVIKKVAVQDIVWITVDPSSGDGFILLKDSYGGVSYVGTTCISSDLQSYIDKLNKILPYEGYGRCRHS